MNHSSLLHLINNVKTYPELMTANTAFLEYLLSNKVSSHNLEQLYKAYNNKKKFLKSELSIYEDSIGS